MPRKRCQVISLKFYTAIIFLFHVHFQPIIYQRYTYFVIFNLTSILHILNKFTDLKCEFVVI